MLTRYYKNQVGLKINNTSFNTHNSPSKKKKLITHKRIIYLLMCMHVKIYKNNEDHEDLLVMYSDKSIQIMSKRLYASSL